MKVELLEEVEEGDQMAAERVSAPSLPGHWCFGGC